MITLHSYLYTYLIYALDYFTRSRVRGSAYIYIYILYTYIILGGSLIADYVYVAKHIHEHTYMNTYIHKQVHMYIKIYTYVYMYVHTYTYGKTTWSRVRGGALAGLSSPSALTIAVANPNPRAILSHSSSAINSSRSTMAST